MKWLWLLLVFIQPVEAMNNSLEVNVGVDTKIELYLVGDSNYQGIDRFEGIDFRGIDDREVFNDKCNEVLGLIDKAYLVKEGNSVVFDDLNRGVYFIRVRDNDCYRFCSSLVYVDGKEVVNVKKVVKSGDSSLLFMYCIGGFISLLAIIMLVRKG